MAVVLLDQNIKDNVMTSSGRTARSRDEVR